jgi:diguanylate cyclase
MMFSVDVLFAVTMAAAGGLAGWWLRGGSAPPVSPHGEEELRRAREVLSRLHEVAAKVAADVGDHSSRVEEINEELSTIKDGDTDVVVGAVAKLVEANNAMQQRLASAEVKLQEQTRLVESASVEARTDPLTGLANRRALDDALAARVAEFQDTGRGFSMVMIDVDKFKRFNDQHGHAAGDEVLRRLAHVLRKNSRDTDLAARFGGEEFCMVFPHESVQDSVKHAERVRQAIAAMKIYFEATALNVTASFGVAQFTAGETAHAVIKRADEALYASKAEGRNCTHWNDGQQNHKAHGEAAGEKAGESPAPAPAPAAAAAAAAAVAVAAAAEDAKAATSKVRATPPGVQRSRTALCVDIGRRLAEWDRGIPLSVILVQIDNYPRIAAEHGQQTADLVLRTTSQFLTAVTRDMDLVAEYDLATFAVQLPGAELTNAITVAERLREAVARCVLSTERGAMRFTVSLGGAEAVDGDKTERLLRRAGESLDSAIRSGGNCSFFHNGHWSETVEAARERAKVACG